MPGLNVGDAIEIRQTNQELSPYLVESGGTSSIVLINRLHIIIDKASDNCYSCKIKLKRKLLDNFIRCVRKIDEEEKMFSGLHKLPG
ncbi:hypothetical protein PORY_000974 [Pneumocystis oryctolagi]|uniref:Uncharacterized protein n=1 Tax=Pneumocystis oryctolagi TaxID=42067 RepID=A0ACB7CEM1_9ASCO|nr:hypothetical protein PORY_000974 [Pneumocystis oryctolagi]